MRLIARLTLVGGLLLAAPAWPQAPVPATSPTEVDRWRAYAEVLREQRDALERALAELRAVVTAQERARREAPRPTP